MKTKINKLLIVTTMSAIVMSGCTPTVSVQSDVRSIDVVENKQVKSAWSVNRGLAGKSVVDDDCITCVATLPRTNKTKVTTYLYDYANAPVDTYDMDETDEKRYAKSRTLSVSPIIESFSNKTSIQVGAFRKYAGAKVYAKKYDLLSNRYNVEIKKNVEENRPLYRVRIEGFSNRSEAKEFILKYGLTEAFLVRN